MMLRWTWRALLLSMCATSLIAQDRAVGSVGEIKAIGVRQGCPGTQPRAAASAVRIQRGGRELLLRQGEKDSIFLGDKYRVSREIDVELVIASVPFGDGALILAPQLLCRYRDADTTLAPYTDASTGEYQLDRSSNGRLQFGVRSGGAFIQWNTKDRPLDVVAAGHTAAVTGTELAITVDSADRAAVLYVREGTVTFPQADNLEALAGSVFELRVGQRPRRLVALRPEATRVFDLDVAFHRAVFEGVTEVAQAPGRSIWRNPWTYAITGVVAVAGVCLATETKCGLKKTNRTGTIVVQIPL